MAPRIDYLGIQFQEGEAGAEQCRRFKNLAQQKMLPTRYTDNSCLRKLGLVSDINFMFEKLGWYYFKTLRDPTYARVTLEFLSSLFYSTPLGCGNVQGQMQFRIFNREYTLSQDHFASSFRFPHGENVICDVPLEGPWNSLFGQFWESMTDEFTIDFEGNDATLIQNPAIRYFRAVLANTIFGRDKDSKVNAKNLYFLFSIFNNVQVNSAAFMFAHMRALCNARKGAIVVGGLITSIAKGLGLVDELKTLEPSDTPYLDIAACRNMRLVRAEPNVKFTLMINHVAYSDIVLPDPDLTNVQNEDNWLYTTQAGIEDDTAPSDADEGAKSENKVNMPEHAPESPDHHSPA